MEHTAEKDIDQTVSAAKATLDPDCERREQDRDEAQEDVASAHGRELCECVC